MTVLKDQHDEDETDFLARALGSLCLVRATPIFVRMLSAKVAGTACRAGCEIGVRAGGRLRLLPGRQGLESTFLGWQHGRMTDELATWLRAHLQADSLRLTKLASERAGTGRPDDRIIVRIAMDQVSTLVAQKHVIEIVERAVAEGVAAEPFEQVLKWMAYQRQGDGYLDTWAPDGVDLVALLSDVEPDDEEEEN